MTSWSDIQVTAETHILLVTLGIQFLVNWPLLSPQSWHMSGSIVPRRLPSLSCRFTCLIIVKPLSHPWLVFVFMGRIQPRLLIFPCTIHPFPRIFFTWHLLLIWFYTVKPRLIHESWTWKGAGWISCFWRFVHDGQGCLFRDPFQTMFWQIYFLGDVYDNLLGSSFYDVKGTFHGDSCGWGGR